MSVMKIVRADEIPFAQIPNDLIRDSSLSGNAVRLWAYLASHNDGYNLTYEQIEQQTGMKQFAIQESAKKLIEAGWLQTVREKDERTKRWLPLSWILLIKATSGNSTMAHSMMEQTIHKNTNNLITDIKKTIDKNIGDFDEFWNVYPLKVGKQAARKAFEKSLTVVTFDVLLAGAERYRDDPNRDIAFTKHASTWLNAGCWDDEPLPERVKSRVELASEQAEKSRLELDKARESTKEFLAAQEALRAENAKDPIQRCEHGIKLLCKVCN